jgi:alkanesulfonate monooxygenase SsuD/methylene tetrahydromethanopterin reductase-like flavin-dependent oxidoreductase (luciferase family)
VVPLSVLDLVPITYGSTAKVALENSLDLAQHAERLGYRRFWVAEHHNMTGIASAATAVVIGYLAGGTSTIRVGAGGVMLPNHSPLVIAEQFGTLETLYDGRIDLGLGRAPGTDPLTTRALRRDPARANDFPSDVQAVPGGGTEVPLWILGSSTFGAQLAAMLGLPYAFASHFAPDHLMEALHVYRSTFRPSAQLDRPHAMVGVNVVVADTDEEAQRLFTTMQQGFANLARGTPGPYLPPVDDMEQHWSPAEKSTASRMLAHSFVGSPETVRTGLERFVNATEADELMTVAAIYDHGQRVRSYELLSELAGDRDAARAG